MTTRHGTDPLDLESRQWLSALGPDSPDRDQTLVRLHGLLLRAARTELHRRSGRTPLVGPELEDLAHQAADDALLSIIKKLDSFRGASRFTTWAYKFAIFEVSNKLGRHFWMRPDVRLDHVGWDVFPDRIGMSPEQAVQSRELLAEVHRIVEDELTDRQRQVFVALVIDGVPLDALVIQSGSNRNAIYKTMFDARRKIRSTLVANGYLDLDTARQR